MSHSLHRGGGLLEMEAESVPPPRPFYCGSLSKFVYSVDGSQKSPDRSNILAWDYMISRTITAFDGLPIHFPETGAPRSDQPATFGTTEIEPPVMD